ncbi:MAG: NAD-dependent epimerase/dehydratase family protein [Sulfuricaulis sp.]
MRILVTGAQGFIGKHLVDGLVGDHDVYGIDMKGGWDLLTPGVADLLVESHNPDVVVHLAAKVGRLFGEDNPAATIADNVTMTAYVAKAAAQHGARLVYASTSEIYGDNNLESCDEYDGPFTRPHNLYGVTKKFGEDICRLYAPKDLTIWRISMPYGPGLPAGRGRAAIVNMLYQALHRQEIVVHKNSERSWCWIGDTVQGMALTLAAGRGVFNIGRDDTPTPMRTVAEIACALTGAPTSLIVEVDPPERQTVVKRLATRRLRSLGWEPTVSLEEGMGRTLEWVKGLQAPLAVAA